MRLTYALFLLFALFSTSSWGAPTNSQDKAKDSDWEEFKTYFPPSQKQHKKEYKTSEKETKARSNFQANDAKIKKHNERHTAGNVSWFTKHNEFSDMSEAEFAQVMLRPIPPANISFPEIHIASVAEANRSLDDRQLYPTVDYSTVRSMGIRNQGSCGSCYVFATLGLLEWYHALKYGGTPDFSEQQIISCSSSYGNDGCNAGTIDNTLRYVLANGLASEYSYPYQQTSISTVSSCKYWSGMKATSLSTFYSYPSFQQIPNDDGVMNAMRNAKGPIAMAVYSNRDWQLYGGAVYDGYCSGVRNHAVVIAGYGWKDGKPYWLVKNSWGQNWGVSGYMYLLRGINQCGVGSDYAWWPLIA